MWLMWSRICSSSTHCPPFPIYYCYDSAGALSLSQRVCDWGGCFLLGVREEEDSNSAISIYSKYVGEPLEQSYFRTIPSTKSGTRRVSVSLSAASASVVVAVLLSEHIILSLAFWSAVPTMIHLFCVVQCAHQYSSSQQFVRVELSCRGVHSRPEQQTNNNPHLLLLHRDYNHINVLYLRYVMLLLLTGVWLCARVTLYADRRGAAQYSSCIVSANQPASQPSFYTAPQSLFIHNKNNVNEIWASSPILHHRQQQQKY